MRHDNPNTRITLAALVCLALASPAFAQKNTPPPGGFGHGPGGPPPDGFGHGHGAPPPGGAHPPDGFGGGRRPPLDGYGQGSSSRFAQRNDGPSNRLTAHAKKKHRQAGRKAKTRTASAARPDLTPK